MKRLSLSPFMASHIFVRIHQSVCLIVLTFVLLAPSPSFSQGGAQTNPVNKEYDFLPPSPNVAELGKYGLVPVNLSTGMMSTSVPLYTLKTANLEVPVTLNYSAGGIRVDQIASQVGLGWSLSAGGVITRTIRDRDDMDYVSQLPYPSNTSSGFTVELVKYLEQAVNESFDSERDLYSFNFQNISGRLVFTRENQPLISPYRKLYIERVIQDDDVMFRITDEAGIKYLFEVDEVTRTISSGADCGKNYEGYLQTGWFLTKIIHPQGDIIYFDYEAYGFNYNASVSQTVTENYNIASRCGGQCSPVQDRLCKSILNSYTKRLTGIRTNGYGDLKFYSSNNRLDVSGEFKMDSIEYVIPGGQVLNKWKFGYVFATNSGLGNAQVNGSDLDRRMFLTSLQKTASNAQPQIYSFEYNDMNGLPKRLSFSQDHWGMFNGQNNAQFFPKSGMVAPKDEGGNVMFQGLGADREPRHTYAVKGMLTKINYPTGGSTVITYDGNKKWGKKTIYPPQELYTLPVTSTMLGGGGVKDSLIVLSGLDQDVKFGINAAYTPDGVEDEIHSLGKISVREIETGNYLISSLVAKAGEYKEKTVTLTAGRHYKITVSANGEGVLANANFRMYDELPTEIDTNIDNGGVRVSQVTHYADANAQPKIERYYYASFSDLLKSSAQNTAPDPIYEERTTTSFQCPPVATPEGPKTMECDFFQCITVSRYSSSILNTSVFGGSNVIYKHVVVAEGDDFSNGYIEHEFKSSRDVAGRVVAGQFLFNAPYSNTSWDNGLESKVETFKKSGSSYSVVNGVSTEHVKDGSISDEVKNMVIRLRDPATQCNRPFTETCNANTIGLKWTIKVCTAAHFHTRVSSVFEPYKCIAAGNNYPQIVEVKHPCYGLADGATITYTAHLENLDIVEYSDFAHWQYVSSTVETNVGTSGVASVTSKSYLYKDKTHLQLTEESTTDSDGRTRSTKYWYPTNYTGLAMTDSLVKRNILAAPIKSESYLGAKIVSGQVTVYNPDGSVLETWRRDNVTSDSIAHSKTVLIPTNYRKDIWIVRDNTIKRPREVHYADGRVATLIWGYNKQYVIAQVMNKTVAEVNAALGNGLSVLETSSDETNINTKIAQLRTALPDVPILSFNYRPGVGLTRQIDQNGRMTNYQYDDLGRLQTVSDHDGNVIKKYDYHYKNATLPSAQ